MTTLKTPAGVVSIGGEPLSTADSLFFDDFNGTELDSDWVDAESIWGNNIFDPIVLTGDGSITVNSHTYNSPWIWGHGMMGIDLGISDNFEVTIGFENPQDGKFLELLHQIAPASHLDLNASNPARMGVCATVDISLPATYLMCTHRNIDIAHTYVGGDTIGLGSNRGIGNSGDYVMGAFNRLKVRCKNHQLSYYWNEHLQHDSTIAVPSDLQSNTLFGVHIISISPPIGSSWFGQTVKRIKPARIQWIRVQQIA